MEWTAPKPTSPSSPPLLWDWGDAAVPDSSGAAAGRRGKEKRAKGEEGGGGGKVRCQVEGCGVELGSAKEYHRKHRVCEAHTKCPRVVVAGQERRFCQQCSRFHALSEFDQKKRSCRRRLSDHNARRRKPQPDVFSFGSAVLPSSLFDDRGQISFLWNKAPLSHEKDQQKLGQSTDKSICADACGAASKLDGAPDVRRALSLLSASSWGSTDPVQQASSLIQFTDANQNGKMSPVSNGGNSNSPFWINGQPLAPESQVVQFTMDTGSTVFQDLERIKPAYESALFSMNQIH